MLGADLAQMSDLARQIQSTTGAIGNCQTSTGRTTSNVVSSVTQNAQTALQQIQAELGELRSSVATSLATANNTNWNGNNAQTFRSAATDFDQAMQRAENATADAFQQFQASIQQMADALSQYQQSFSAALSNASSSSTSMQNAVEKQRAQLDDTMNTGMSVG